MFGNATNAPQAAKILKGLGRDLSSNFSKLIFFIFNV